jgi:hypothetical protein
MINEFGFAEHDFFYNNLSENSKHFKEAGLKPPNKALVKRTIA